MNITKLSPHSSLCCNQDGLVDWCLTNIMFTTNRLYIVPYEYEIYYVERGTTKIHNQTMKQYI